MPESGTTSGRGRTALAYLALLLLASAVVRSPTLVSHNFNVDEAIYTSLAVEMLDGALYYRDVVDHKPPGIYYIYAAIYAVAGPYRLQAVHLAMMIWVALTGLVLWRLGARLFSERSGRLAGLLYVVVGAHGTPMDIQAANAELFMNLPLVAGVWLYVRTRQRGGRWGYLAAGLALSCGALIKFQAGFPAAAVALHLLLTPGPRAAPLLLGALGLAAPPLAHALLYLRAGAWDELRWALTFNSTYVGAAGAGFQLKRAAVRSATFIGFQWAVVLPAVAYLVRGRRDADPDGHRAWLLLSAWLVTSMAAVAVGGRYFIHYYLQLTPPLALMAAHALQGWTARRPALWRVAAGLVALASAAWIAVALLDRTLRPREAWHQDRYRAVGAWVRRHTRPQQRIFVWGDSPGIYLNARRRMGTRYLWVNYQTGRIWGTPYDELGSPPPPPQLVARETWAPLLSDLQQNRPELIIDAAAGRLDEFDEHPLWRYPQVARIVRQRYRLETTVLGVPIYRLNR
jgi:4-amino-4-deoxy-L-arabinose transferase-like glycosyltransferase